MKFSLLFILFCIPLFSEDFSQNDKNFSDEVFCEEVLCKNLHEAFKPHETHQFEPVLSAECEPLASVADCVNLVSGDFFQINHDMTIGPLSLTRIYDSGSKSEFIFGFGFGSQFPLWASSLEQTKKHCYAAISEREGFLIPYAGRTKKMSVDPRLFEKGYTNLSRTALSGHANLINWKAYYLEDHWVVKLGDGTIRSYGLGVKLESNLRKKLRFPTHYAYLLTHEIKPNGQKLSFDYDTHLRLLKIKAKDKTGALFGKLDFSYDKGCCTVTSSSGEMVKYAFHKDLKNY